MSGTVAMKANVLVLNASYEAINVCNLKRAMKMVFKGVASMEEVADWEIRSPSASVKVPLVIRLVNYVHIPHCVVKFSRRNVLARDQYTCQYCHLRFSPAALTLDHVLPRSRGGTTGWENVVTACKKCNSKKGDWTPYEARMFPKRFPKAPSIISYLHLSRTSRSYDESWKKYLYIN